MGLTYEQSIRTLIALLLVSLLVSLFTEQLWLTAGAVVMMLFALLIDLWVNMDAPDDPAMLAVWQELRIRGKRVSRA